jgi:EmrB/QacA subfamily drug resistance transporter
MAKVREKERLWTLVAMILCSGTVFLTSTVVNVALPTIERALGARLAGLQWIVDGYTLTLAALMMLGGALGDRFGRRRVMLGGTVGFASAALACGLAPSLSWLIGARVLQGAAGALMVPGALAILRAVFPEGEERGRAIGRWSGWAGIATVVGPPLGGWLVDVLSWRWAFFVAVPPLAAAAWLLARYVPKSHGEEGARGLDWAGTATIVVGLGGLAYGLIQGPALGWSTPSVLASLGGGALALALFPLVEARVSRPLVPLHLFTSRNFTGANLTTLGVYFALTGTNFFLVLFLRNVGGYSALEAGLATAPLSLLLLLLSSTMGSLSAEHGARWFMTVGPLVCAAGLLLFRRVDARAAYWGDVLPAVAVLGVGLGITVAPLTNTVMSAVEKTYAGVASAFNNTTSRVAGLLAIALLGVVVTASFDAALAQRTAELDLTQETRSQLARVAENPTGAADVEGLPEGARGALDAAYAAAFHRVMTVAAAAAAAGGVAAVLMVRDEPLES